MTINLSPAFKPAFKSKSRYRVMYGGAGSGKSHYKAQETLLGMLESPHHNELVVRKTGKSIRNSVFRLLTGLISEYDLSSAFRINKTEMSIVCINGATLITSGLDDVEKLKSVAGINRIWVEEASEISENDFDQLDLRLRGPSEIGHQLTLTFNPVSELSWIKKRFFDVGVEDSFILKTTYLDNPFIDDQYKRTLERLKKSNEQYYNIYALGEWGSMGNLIFTNWCKEDLTEQIPTFDNVRNGLDFGFAEDPTAFVRVHYDKKRKRIYIYKEFKQSGLFIDVLADKLKPIIGNEIITADSADPRSIADLRRNGIKAKGAKKGKDSILHGITWLQSHEIIIHQECQETIAEFSTYQWKEDKDGNVLPVPIDMNNHIIDALRYGLEEEMVFEDRSIRTMSKAALGL